MKDKRDDRQLESHFEFGKNWQNLVNRLTEDSVLESQNTLARFLGTSSLAGKSFLDIGCGSGLSSLAAYRMGAESILSVDIDPQNIANVNAVKAKFAVPRSFPWTCAQTSIVAADQARTLPISDIVYSWGVLHHTGAMWEGLENCAHLVKPGGVLYIMLYRDAVLAGSWRRIKYLYTRAPKWGQAAMRNTFAGLLILGALLKGKNPWKTIRNYKTRGMSWYIDVTDWVGGYPFEYASYEEVLKFLKTRGFELVKVSPEPDGRWNLGYRGTGSYEYLARKVINS